MCALLLLVSIFSIGEGVRRKNPFPIKTGPYSEDRPGSSNGHPDVASSSASQYPSSSASQYPFILGFAIPNGHPDVASSSASQYPSQHPKVVSSSASQNPGVLVPHTFAKSAVQNFPWATAHGAQCNPIELDRKTHSIRGTNLKPPLHRHHSDARRTTAGHPISVTQPNVANLPSPNTRMRDHFITVPRITTGPLRHIRSGAPYQRGDQEHDHVSYRIREFQLKPPQRQSHYTVRQQLRGHIDKTSSHVPYAHGTQENPIYIEHGNVPVAAARLTPLTTAPQLMYEGLPGAYEQCSSGGSAQHSQRYPIHPNPCEHTDTRNTFAQTTNMDSGHELWILVIDMLKMGTFSNTVVLTEITEIRSFRVVNIGHLALAWQLASGTPKTTDDAMREFGERLTTAKILFRQEPAIDSIIYYFNLSNKRVREIISSCTISDTFTKSVAKTLYGNGIGQRPRDYEKPLWQLIVDLLCWGNAFNGIVVNLSGTHVSDFTIQNAVLLTQAWSRVTGLPKLSKIKFLVASDLINRGIVKRRGTIVSPYDLSFDTEKTTVAKYIKMRAQNRPAYLLEGSPTFLSLQLVIKSATCSILPPPSQGLFFRKENREISHHPSVYAPETEDISDDDLPSTQDISESISDDNLPSDDDQISHHTSVYAPEVEDISDEEVTENGVGEN